LDSGAEDVQASRDASRALTFPQREPEMLGKVKLDHGYVRPGIDKHHRGDSTRRACKLHGKQRALGTERTDADFLELE